MSREMASYQITAELSGWSRQRKALRVLLAASVLIACLIGSRVLFLSYRLDVSELIFLGVFTVVEGVFRFSKWNLEYTVVVSDDSITAAHWLFKRSIQRNCVRTVIETRGNAFTPAALRISKHGRFGMWLWGSISIPRELPEYESIRTLVLSWRTDQ